MKKTLKQTFFISLCCVFLILLLFQSPKCIQLASNGLLIWYRNMIPSLFPFMVLSGFLIRSELSVKIGQWLQPVLGSLFRLPSSMIYAIFMGFLCGFPMGAKMVSDMLQKKQITLKEGEYLLAFCNNIGPLYMLGYVIPLFGYKNPFTILGWMYLIPLGYGLFLRYFSGTFHISSHLKIHSSQNPSKRESFSKKLSLSKVTYQHGFIACSYHPDNSTNYLTCFQQSLSAAIEQITMLGGCMVFFNCLLIFPEMLEFLLSHQHPGSYDFTYIISILSSFIEIGGGLKQLALCSVNETPIWNQIGVPLTLLTFGGLSCIAQTCFILKNTGLKISTYIKHKLIQSCIFLLLIIISPGR